MRLRCAYYEGALVNLSYSISLSQSFTEVNKKNSRSTLCVPMLSPQDGFTPLHVASQNGHSQVGEVLLSKGADVNLPKKVQYMSKCNTCYRYSDH